MKHNIYILKTPYSRANCEQTHACMSQVEHSTTACCLIPYRWEVISIICPYVRISQANACKSCGHVQPAHDQRASYLRSLVLAAGGKVWVRDYYLRASVYRTTTFSAKRCLTFNVNHCMHVRAWYVHVWLPLISLNVNDTLASFVLAVAILRASLYIEIFRGNSPVVLPPRDLGWSRP